MRRRADNGRPRQVTYWKWIEKFHPVRNQFRDDAPIDNYVFYPWFDEELEFVRLQPPLNVWTFVINRGRWYIISGYHWVNREGYLVTEVPIGPDEWWSIYY